MKTPQQPRGRVLLVDDDADVLAVLGAGIEAAGYEVVRAASGAAAISAYQASTQAAADDSADHRDGAAFDVALVDMQMPELDGIEVVRELKRLAGVNDFLPVVLITGLEDSDARVRGFEAGCDDFLHKPVNLIELQARLHTLVRRRQQHAELMVANHRLRDAQARKQMLASLVVHDLRNPLSALQGNVELLIEEMQETSGSDMAAEILDDCKALVQKSLSMVAGLLDVEELEEGLLVARPVDTDLSEMCQHAARHHGAALKLRQLDLQFRIEPGLRGTLDADLIGRLVENLLDNAVRYASRKGLVVVAAEHAGDDLILRVGNNGPAVPEAELPRIFGRYYRLEARREGARANRGLGLFFCRLVAEAHGGTIEVHGDEELPASFVVRLPQSLARLS